MTRVTKKQIEEIKRLSSEGKKQKDIAVIIKISKTAVLYHLNGDYAEGRKIRSKEAYKKLSKKEKRELYLKRKEYTKKYLKDRYKNDFQFRRKHIERVILGRRMKNLKGGEKRPASGQV